MQDEDRIRERAHQIWEGEGRPEGRHAEHWEQARREIEAERLGGAADPEDSPTLTAPDHGGATPGEAAAAAASPTGQGSKGGSRKR
jgi:hypothetical protein